LGWSAADLQFQAAQETARQACDAQLNNLTVCPNGQPSTQATAALLSQLLAIRILITQADLNAAGIVYTITVGSTQAGAFSNYQGLVNWQTTLTARTAYILANRQ